MDDFVMKFFKPIILLWIVSSLFVAAESFENSLGMKFLQVPQTQSMMSIWETRRSDFEKFTQVAGFHAEGGIWSLKEGRWARHGETWQNPGFEQGPPHPVVGVSWNEAKAFCEWLTFEEQKRGRLPKGKRYRLPTEREWMAVIGTSEYPWGASWPPPAGVENLAGGEVLGEGWPRFWRYLEGYQDRHIRTAPVGSYTPNAHGFYDLGGNVLEWGEEFFREGETPRILRGGGWTGALPEHLKSQRRGKAEPGFRSDSVGFRIVLVSEE